MFLSSSSLSNDESVFLYKQDNKVKLSNAYFGFSFTEVDFCDRAKAAEEGPPLFNKSSGNGYNATEYPQINGKIRMEELPSFNYKRFCYWPILLCVWAEKRKICSAQELLTFLHATNLNAKDY